MSKLTFSIIKKISKAVVGKNFGRIPFLKSFYYKSFFKFMPDVLEVNGMKMRINKEDRLVSYDILVNGTHEKCETELVKREIEEGMTVIDAGANIGYYTLLFAQKVGPSGKVYAFEPDPTNFSILQKNVQMNGFENIVLVNKALSDSVGTASLFLSEYNKGGHSLFNFNKEKNSIVIETTSLDEYFKDSRPKIDFIKLDTEGAEGKIFFGMKELLQRNKNLKMITEFSVIGLTSSGIEPEKFLKNIVDEGFSVFRINEKDGKVEPVDVLNDMKRMIDSRGEYNNLFCVR